MYSILSVPGVYTCKCIDFNEDLEDRAVWSVHVPRLDVNAMMNTEDRWNCIASTNNSYQCIIETTSIR